LTQKFKQNNNNIIYIKNEDNFMENLVAPAPKLFGNEIVRHRNGPQWNWRSRKWRQQNCSTKKSCFPAHSWHPKGY